MPDVNMDGITFKKLEATLSEATRALDGTDDAKSAFNRAKNAREAYFRYKDGLIDQPTAKAILEKNGTGFGRWNGED